MPVGMGCVGRWGSTRMGAQCVGTCNKGPGEVGKGYGGYRWGKCNAMGLWGLACGEEEEQVFKSSVHRTMLHGRSYNVQWGWGLGWVVSALLEVLPKTTCERARTRGQRRRARAL